MNPSMKGYIPEQIASGALENGEHVVILYIKEFSHQLKHVNKSGHIGYIYSWSYVEDNDSYVLYVCWENKVDIAVVFGPRQHPVVEQLKEPKNLIITSLPINVLVDKARTAGESFLDLEDSVFLEKVKFSIASETLN